MTSRPRGKPSRTSRAAGCRWWPAAGEPAAPRRGRRPGASRSRVAPAHPGPAVARRCGRRAGRGGEPRTVSVSGAVWGRPGRSRRHVRRTPVVVGDRVRLVGDTSGQVDTLARIVDVLPRRSVLNRSPDDQDPVERPVVANADLLVIVAALANPPPRPRLVDRCLVAAFDGGLDPLLCLTKSDLADAQELTSRYEPLGLQGRRVGLGGWRRRRRRLAAPGRRADELLLRAFGRGEVHARQRLGAACRTAHGRGQRDDRPGAAHDRVRDRIAAADRRMGDRHAGRADARPGACVGRASPCGVPGSGGRHRDVSAWVSAHRGRPGVRTGPGVGAGRALRSRAGSGAAGPTAERVDSFRRLLASLGGEDHEQVISAVKISQAIVIPPSTASVCPVM